MKRAWKLSCQLNWNIILKLKKGICIIDKIMDPGTATNEIDERVALFFQNVYFSYLNIKIQGKERRNS